MESLKELRLEIYRAGKKAEHNEDFKNKILNEQKRITGEFDNDEKKKKFEKIIAKRYNVCLCNTFESEAVDADDKCLVLGADGASYSDLSQEAKKGFKEAWNDGELAGLTTNQLEAAKILGEIRYRTLFR